MGPTQTRSPIMTEDVGSAVVPTPEKPPMRWLRVEIWAVLATLATALFLFQLVVFADRDDNEHLETTLVNVAAGQFSSGPSTIYGPFSRANPRVLIQAPLYYRLTGLMAWVPVRLGVSPVRACQFAGRAISFASFLGLIALVLRIATLDGMPKRAASWAMLLVVSSPVVGFYPVMTRPDVLGVFLQTLGVFLVLSVVLREGAPARRVLAASLAFALAFCVKQHDVSPMIVSAGLLSIAWIKRRELRRAVERAFLAGVALVIAYYLAEDVITSGRMSHAVFVLPSVFRGYGQDDWLGVVSFTLSIAARSIGLVGLAFACLLVRPRLLCDRRLDAILWAYLVVDLVVLEVISFNNPGAYFNYAIQAVVFGSLLTGRALSRAVETRRPAWRVFPIAAVVLLFAVEDLAFLERVFRQRLATAASLSSLLREPTLRGRRREETYFVGLPQYNRLVGRQDLAHDEWLYGQFERARQAEPRSQWLLPEFTRGPIRFVIIPQDPPIAIPQDPPVIPGLFVSLKDLGFDRIGEIGRFRIWERRRPPADVGNVRR